jgi:hypothetical protein
MSRISRGRRQLFERLSAGAAKTGVAGSGAHEDGPDRMKAGRVKV